jgi:hypothetical protein
MATLFEDKKPLMKDFNQLVELITLQKVNESISNRVMKHFSLYSELINEMTTGQLITFF